MSSSTSLRGASTHGDMVVRAEGLGKRYQTGRRSAPARYTALRDILAGYLRAPMRALRDKREREEIEREFWALRDVDFEIARGQAVGVIGRNGAGKSTLLKVLSRITEPTTGRVTLNGRVASLLEVGTGFHPELTGRENVFLNGAILGMPRSEIRAKFDEIVEFAGVSRFLDTPVKRYSSGMYVRLAFAVAAHLEPDVLVIDEVLAVGDAQFQRKCLGKMNEVTHGGERTVLFVSHNMDAVRALCARSIYLVDGTVAADGPTEQVLAMYEASVREGAIGPRNTRRELGGGLALVAVEISPSQAQAGSSVTLTLHFDAREPIRIYEVCLLLHSPLGGRAAIFDLRRPEGDYHLEAGQGVRLAVTVDELLFVPGEYPIGMWLNADKTSGDFLDLATLDVQPADTGSAFVLPYAPHLRGVVELPYTVHPIEACTPATT